MTIQSRINQILDIRKWIHRPVIEMTKTRVRYELDVKGACPEQKYLPTIYAVNHTNSADIPMACRAIGRHCLVLIGKQPLYLSDRLFFFLNGAVWVDRKDRQDMQRAKMDLIRLLRKGKSIIWFPEGTWNMTENLLMLPMKWGIIDVAQKANARIVPVALEYDREKNRCGAAISPPLSSIDISKQDGIVALRDAIASLRWQLWEEKGIYSRSKIDVSKERRVFLDSVNEYQPLDIHYEKSVVFHPPEEIAPSDAFQHLDDLTPCRENAFLFNKRLTGGGG